MGTSPELIPVPASQMLLALYQPGEAASLLKHMSPEEISTVAELMNLCAERQEMLKQLVSSPSSNALDDTLLRQRNVMAKNVTITPNILLYFRCLGYDPLPITESLLGVNSSKLLLSW